jgi:hypothetical protein
VDAISVADASQFVGGQATVRKRSCRPCDSGWSMPRTLNDPDDMQFGLRYEVDRDVVQRLALDNLWGAYHGAPVAVGNVLGVWVQEQQHVGQRNTPWPARDHLRQQSPRRTLSSALDFATDVPSSRVTKIRFALDQKSSTDLSPIPCLFRFSASSKAISTADRTHCRIALFFHVI